MRASRRPSLSLVQAARHWLNRFLDERGDFGDSKWHWHEGGFEAGAEAWDYQWWKEVSVVKGQDSLPFEWVHAESRTLHYGGIGRSSSRSPRLRDYTRATLYLISISHGDDRDVSETKMFDGVEGGL